MKNLPLLIRVLIFITYSSSLLAQNNPEELYISAKNSLEINNCNSVITLLTEYLQYKTNPAKKKMESINSVIEWCKNYLERGNDIEVISGVSHGGRQGVFYHENALGAEMRKNKKQLHLY